MPVHFTEAEADQSMSNTAHTDTNEHGRLNDKGEAHAKASQRATFGDALEEHSYLIDTIAEISSYRTGLPGSNLRDIPSRSRAAWDAVAYNKPASQDQISEHGSSSDDENDVVETPTADDYVVHTTTEQRERLEWQSMLRSVLDGDVLSAEKARVGIAETEPEVTDSFERWQTRFATLDTWLASRGKLRGRTLEEERKRVEHRRLRIGENLLEAVITFSYDKTSPLSATEQVNNLLRRLDAVESLYPTLKHMYADKPSLDDPVFKARIDAMTAWINLTGMINQHLSMLRKWTGSKTLDILAPNTTTEVPITSALSPGPRTRKSDVLDDSTFVERVLKENSIVKIFKRRALVDVLFIVARANRILEKRSAIFDSMNLPSVQDELRELLTFPTKLMQASLQVQLDYGSRVKDLDILRIDQMTEDFKVSIKEACKRKAEYKSLVVNNAALEKGLSPDYDKTVLEAVSRFFGLLQRRLKSGVAMKGAFFKETDFLESQWDLLDMVALQIKGGSVLVAEKLCNVMHRLIARGTDSFEHQIWNPSIVPSPLTRPSSFTGHPAASPGYEEDGGKDVLEAYTRLLDEVRLRHRKIRRFARVLTNRFSTAAEYDMSELNIDLFINRLIDTGHALVLSENYQATGAFIITAGGLKKRQHEMASILQNAFRAHDRKEGPRVVKPPTLKRSTINPIAKANLAESDDPPASATLPDSIKSRSNRSEEDLLDDLPEDTVSSNEDPSSYLIIFRPIYRFLWHGEIILGANLPLIDLGIQSQRLMLLADGGEVQLSRAKEQFASHFTYDLETGQEDSLEERSHTNGHVPSMGVLPCQIELRSHLPKVNKELDRIARAIARLANRIVESVHPVREAIRNSVGYQELLESWFIFAAEHGHQIKATNLDFNRSLTRLAISWVAFICDECDPNDRKTFKWAVNALEFARNRVGDHVILHLPDDQFILLRRKVAMCMTLLIQHFDILGARTSYEAKRERELQDELRRQQALEAKLQTEDDVYLSEVMKVNEDTGVETCGFVASASNLSIRAHRTELQSLLDGLDKKRIAPHGRVLDDSLPADRTLFLLASSHANVSIRWQQGKFIGGGAFGSVYLASNMDTGAVMAVKEIRFQDVAGSLPNLYKQIRDELNIMEMLRHPNIVEYYGIEVHRDRVYIFEEYCQGGSLASLLELGRIEDETVIQLYALQMLEGLNYLHAHNVVHRDIKPDNILLDHRGVIKFVDFGASKIIVRNRTLQRTRAIIDSNGVAGNSLTGTPMYMSPEMIKNDRPGRPGSMDIWAMGCVILEAATGRKPWSNLDNEWAIMFHIGVATKHPPLPEPGQLSDCGISFIKSCLIIDAMQRPSASELLEHPWIISIKDQLANDDEHMSVDEGAVPIQAAFMDASEINTLNNGESNLSVEPTKVLDEANGITLLVTEEAS